MFNLENLVINRPLRGTMFDKGTNEVLYSVDQLSEASLECSGEQVYVTDALGKNIAAFDRSKNATFSATNALINLGLAAAQMGTDKEVADESSTILSPVFEAIQIGESAGTVNKTITLSKKPAGPANAEITHIYLMDSQKGIRKQKYDLGEGADCFQIADGVITLPTSVEFAAADEIAVWYETASDNAVRITNSADAFAKGGKFVLEVLLADICDPNVEYYGYVVFNNAKMDNNVTLGFNNEATHAFTINAMQDYCSKNKELFQIIVVED